MVALIIFYLLEQLVNVINQWRIARNAQIAPMHENGFAKSLVQHQQKGSEEGLNQTATPIENERMATMHHGHSHAFHEATSATSTITTISSMGES